jgi:hypothetical protein
MPKPMMIESAPSRAEIGRSYYSRISIETNEKKISYRYRDRALIEVKITGHKER